MKLHFNPIKYLLRMLRPGTDIKAKKTAAALSKVSGETVAAETLEELHAAHDPERIITQFLPVFYHRDIRKLERHNPKAKEKQQAKAIVIATLEKMAQLTTVTSTFVVKGADDAAPTDDGKPKISKASELRKLEVRILQEQIEASRKAQDKPTKLKKLRPHIKTCLELCESTLHNIAKDENITLPS